MTADGSRVYRYKGHFFSYWTDWDAHPQLLGLHAAAEIPRDSTSFDAYVRLKKVELQNLLKLEARKKSPSERMKMCLEGLLEDVDDERDIIEGDYFFHFELGEEPPVYGCFTYEIDLDNFIFYFLGEPMFDLRNMPDKDQYLAYLESVDIMEWNLKFPEVREGHRYKVPPPVVEDSSWLKAYKRLGARCTNIHNVLGVGPHMNHIETTRMKIMEICLLASLPFMKNSCGLGLNAMLLDPIPYRALSRLHNICDLFSGPLVFDNSDQFSKWELLRKDYLKPDYDRRIFRWLDKGYLCMLAVNRLDSEDTLRAEIASLADQIAAFYKEDCTNKSTFYGAILSIYDVCIVRLRVVNHRVQVESHTPALRYLPQNQSSSTYTPGIEALSRLGNLIYQNYLHRKFLTRRSRRHKLWSGGKLLPTEIYLRIAQYLPYRTITSLASVSLQWAHIAIEMLQHPYFIIRSEDCQQQPYSYRVLPTIRQDPGPEGFLYPVLFQALDDCGRDVKIHLTTDVTAELRQRQESYCLGEGLELHEWRKKCQIRAVIDNI
ncbi:hypothetical protein EV360DRAFT_79250 [Lentinula raphanica]|nr:hypothetical protein EV360DRAFT_79250 [Lentinula raphanica]